MSLEAMKQAFNSLREMRNALSRAHDTMRRPTKYVIAAMKENESAITALRQAIEQAEDEPRHISYACPNCHWSLDKQVRTHTPEDIKKIESKWVSLTDEEIKEIVGPWGDASIKGYTRKLFDAIEAKLREKNA